MKEHKPIQAYVLTKNGHALTDAGVRFVTDFVIRECAPNDASVTGVMSHTGPDLLKPKALAGIIESDPECAVVIHDGNGIVSILRNKGNLVEFLKGLPAEADAWTAITEECRDVIAERNKK